MDALTKLIESGELSGFRGYPEGHDGGPHVQQLQKVFREYFGVKHAIAMNSATSALHAALIATIEKGDRVVVSPYTFSASASCVLLAGGIPVFADIDPDTFCITPETIRNACRTKAGGFQTPKAIIPVHLCGGMADVRHMDAPFIIEDAAQAIGAWDGDYAGTIGDCGIFSFNQSKHINTGEGGMLITNDDKIARIVRAVRNHGEVSDPTLKIVGYNYRLGEIEALLALPQFAGIDQNLAIRNMLETHLSSGLSKIEGLTVPYRNPRAYHSWYTYPLKIDESWGDKWELCDKLKEKGVYFGTYVKPLHLLPIYEQFGYKEGDCPVAERMWSKELIVTDTLRPTNTISEMNGIIRAFEEIREEM